jgi:hypothetical protein
MDYYRPKNKANLSAKQPATQPATQPAKLPSATGRVNCSEQEALSHTCNTCQPQKVRLYDEEKCCSIFNFILSKGFHNSRAFKVSKPSILGYKYLS